MTFPSDEIIEIDEDGKVHKIESHFKMTRQEVEYFVNNIQHEYLNKDTYYEAMNLIKRMRQFLGKEV